MNGKWNGFGKKFYENGNVWYEGECKDNIPNGIGRYNR